MTASPSDAGLQIGHVAEVSGENKSAIRYWTDKGLLRPTGRTKARYFLYGPDVFDVIAKIKALQRDHMSLEEIKEVLYGDQPSLF